MLPWLFISKFDENPNKMPAQLLTKLQWQTFLFNRFRVSAYCWGVWLRKTVFSWVVNLKRSFNQNIYLLSSTSSQNRKSNFFFMSDSIISKSATQTTDHPTHLFHFSWRIEDEKNFNLIWSIGIWMAWSKISICNRKKKLKLAFVNLIFHIILSCYIFTCYVIIEL